MNINVECVLILDKPRSTLKIIMRNMRGIFTNNNTCGIISMHHTKTLTSTNITLQCISFKPNSDNHTNSSPVGKIEKGKSLLMQKKRG